MEEALSSGGVGCLLCCYLAILTTLTTHQSICIDPVRMMLVSWRQYSAAFIRKVILAAETIGNCAAGQQFGVTEGSVNGRRKQEEALCACSGMRKKFLGAKEWSVSPRLSRTWPPSCESNVLHTWPWISSCYKLGCALVNDPWSPNAWKQPPYCHLQCITLAD